jgi:7tm Chemosensory receptor
MRFAVYGDALDNIIGNIVVSAILLASFVNHRKFVTLFNKMAAMDGQFRKLGETFDASKKNLTRFILVEMVAMVAFGVAIRWHILCASTFLGQILDLHTFIAWYSAKIYIPLVLVQLMYYLYYVLRYFEAECEMFKSFYNKGSWLP